MASFSKVILMGNVTRDPEVRFAGSGTPIAGFGIGINRRYKGNDGNLKDETCFVDITFFGKQAEVCQNYVHKGDSIVIEGRLKQDNWEGKDGQKRSKLVVVGEKLHLMPKKGAKNQDESEDSSVEAVGEAPAEEYKSSEKTTKKKKSDEIPF